MHHCSIDITLHSQLDIEKLPEYRPNPRDDHGITRFMPKPFESKTSTCSVFVPALPGTAFWISYAVSPPVPDEHYFFFKLYIDGAHIVSWSTGKAEGWQGKTMFGLFESSEDAEGVKKIEKRVLCFAPPRENDRHRVGIMDVFDETACVEIRVHRAHARKRIQRQVEIYEDTLHAKEGRGINLVNAGRAGPEQPKRFYKFALIDPVDRPFATFRYYYRTRDQLRDLEVLRSEHNGIGEENDLLVIEPHDASVRSISTDQETHSLVNSGLQNDFGIDKGETNTTKNWNTISNKDTSAATAQASKWQPRTYVPHVTPSPRVEELDEQSDKQALQRDSFMPKPPPSYRLSIPPSIKLEPTKPTIRPLPSLPQRNVSRVHPIYHPNPVFAMGDRTMRTHSPAKPSGEETLTSSSKECTGRGRMESSLMNAIASVWKHRSRQTPRAVASTNNM
ncbi:hypothetical protein COCSADRAFT_345868 [Bipolaris sorokiniana ND90Pr]|uniref:DUF7918 domain-containing protein n=1 Tax=Cochliobolus sativus (strain ND90Pr / ATCC 201652) TaxID=665912 RepID=M2SDL8_COCSN|nr:uncharacterized protein COCSADRAFT_345868 [Bipolaris sorokiniana ND90Pr]EMD60575.1 hypothetical protein COCSADRAFT_345868 [Bipolaris sorokiniana ND90Pr]